MLRRLFFLFPDTGHAERVVAELIDRGIHRRRMHAIASGGDLGSLPEATERQKKDTRFRLEWFIWNTNLVLFMLAMIVFIASLVTGSVLWTALLLIIRRCQLDNRYTRNLKEMNDDDGNHFTALPG